MTDNQAGTLAPDVRKITVNLLLCQGVERTDRLIQYQKRRLPENGPRQRNLLPLTPAKLATVIKKPPDNRIIPLWQRTQQSVYPRLPGRLGYQRRSLRLVYITHPDIVARRHIVKHKILENNRKEPAVSHRIHMNNVLSIKQYRTLLRVIQPAKQLHKGTFAGTVGTYQRDSLTFADGK